MALLTGGTSASTSLNAWLVTRATGSAITNIALVNAGIKDDLNPAHPRWPQALSPSGLLFIPNRGTVQCLPGDYIMFDTTTGWPILVSSYAIASGPWAHS